MRKKIGLDIDGTVTSPNTFLPFINHDFKVNLTLDDITNYDLTTILGVSEEKFWKWMDKTEPVIYSSAPLAPFSKEVLTDWQEQHELIYISARRHHLLDVTYDWFKKFKVPYQTVECIGGHDKVAMVKKYDLDIFFEDKHDNACAIAESCNIPVILFDTPYNRQSVPKNVSRVTNWKEAKQLADEWLK